MTKSVKSEINRRVKKQEMLNREWYSLRSILGNDWAIFYMLLGGREAGKSYAVTDFFLRQWKTKGRPFYWIRLSEASQKKLLANNADKLIDPDLRRKYNIDLVTNGDGIYEVTKRDDKNKIKEKKLIGRVLALSTFYNDKGNGLFDKDFLDDPNMYYNICLDEMNREANERKTFDIVYAFVNQMENLVRSTKHNIRIICVGNTLEEASDLMCAFDFLPEEFGRYTLVKNKKILIQMLKELKNSKSNERQAIYEKYHGINFGKRCVVEYIPENEKYIDRRSGTVANTLAGNSPTFTNKIQTDTTLITKQRLIKPSYVIQFDKNNLFTVWDSNVVAQYHNEKVRKIPMRPYLDELYNIEAVNTVINLFDTRCFLFRNLITQKQFKKQLELLKPRK